MANETQKFLSYEGLGTYDSKIKAYIVDKADAAKTSAIAADAVVVTTDVTTEGYAKSYTFTQNGATIATVDIPKDMVVSSGKVVVNPEGQDEGTYLELTLPKRCLYKIPVRIPLFNRIKQTFNIFSLDNHIHVIIPGNKSPMPDGSKSGSPGKHIGNI